MRLIDQASAFRRDYKRLSRSISDLDGMLMPIVMSLARDEQLPYRCRDHSLTGNWSGYRECHIRPDLLLIYRKIDADVLALARLGSHSTLFG
jgi:mRNA interferase YafQ